MWSSQYLQYSVHYNTVLKMILIIIIRLQYRQWICYFVSYGSGDRYIGHETSQAEANDKIVQVTGYRRVMVKTMTKSGSVPQFGYCDEVRMDAVMRQVLQKS